MQGSTWPYDHGRDVCALMLSLGWSWNSACYYLLTGSSSNLTRACFRRSRLGLNHLTTLRRLILIEPWLTSILRWNRLLKTSRVSSFHACSISNRSRLRYSWRFRLSLTYYPLPLVVSRAWNSLLTALWLKLKVLSLLLLSCCGSILKLSTLPSNVWSCLLAHWLVHFLKPLFFLLWSLV
jgi:hypothetical protein